METRAQRETLCMEMNLIWHSELPYYSFQRWWYERGEIVKFSRGTNKILAVKITQLEPRSRYCLKPREKLITAKPITKLELLEIPRPYFILLV